MAGSRTLSGKQIGKAEVIYFYNSRQQKFEQWEKGVKIKNWPICSDLPGSIIFAAV
jgi:hypothetical protein